MNGGLISDEGIIYVWGENKRGQLGESSDNGGRNGSIPLPKSLGREFFGGRSVLSVHSGWTHMVARLGKYM